MSISKGFLGTVRLCFLTGLALVTLFPILYAVLSSFKSNMDVLASSSLIPTSFHIQNYTDAWKLGHFDRYIWNSMYMTFFIVVGTVLTSTMGGYVFARGKFRGKDAIFAMLVSTMFISAGTLYLYPQLNMAKAFNIHTSLWGVIIINILSFNITQLYLSRKYIETISPEIDEAAKMDGCSFFRIFWNMMFPLVRPLIATIGLLSFMHAWNDYLLPMVFTIGSPQNVPLIVGVIGLKSQGQTVTSWNLMLAGTSMSIVPMLIVFLCLNRFFVAGLTSGAIKG
ncbi:carbohydrate ABC transporter permease [Paenibacillus filicis]|uniref:Carbohydrate ABC transporter permease n=1 Tax=Paenibacillus filicis TaxID=669464 RepID=A0ABU9DI10_9BACL